jgi:hypothetical protein
MEQSLEAEKISKSPKIPRGCWMQAAKMSSFVMPLRQGRHISKSVFTSIDTAKATAIAMVTVIFNATS